jgi:hypothetical protein
MLARISHRISADGAICYRREGGDGLLVLGEGDEDGICTRRLGAAVGAALVEGGELAVSGSWGRSAGYRSLACASAKACCEGQAEAMAMWMRRTLTRTSAPILSSFSRMVAQVAVANSVCARPMRRSAHSST